MRRQNRIEEVDRIVEMGVLDQELPQTTLQRDARLVHTMRGVVVIVDVTKSMGMKDFKPSRLAAAVVAVREFLRLLKQSTPVAMAALGLASQGFCRMVCGLTYDTEGLVSLLDEIRLEENPGCFSFESSLYQAIACLDNLKTCFHREILVIQSSPMTKDQHNLFETVQVLKEAGVTLNVISLCGWTEAIKRSVEKLKGRYVTVATPEECLREVRELSRPPDFCYEAVKVQLLRMGLVKKEQSLGEKRCFCHFKPIKVAYVCTVCECTLCQEPPIECPICETILVMPTDLYNHTVS